MKALTSCDRSIFNAAPDGAMMIDSRWEILMANGSMELLSGCSAKDPVGRNVDTFLPACTNRTFAATKDERHNWQNFQGPAMHGGMLE